MHRFVCLMALSLFSAFSHAGMSLSHAEICGYQHVNAEQIFDALDRGEAPEQIRELLYAANLDIQKDPQIAALAVGASADLEAAKGYLAGAQTGDAEAMYKLGVLLLTRGPDPASAPAEQLEAWKPVGNRLAAPRWIEQSAEAGHKPAIAMLCESGKDPQAPAARREAARRWCEKPAHGPDLRRVRESREVTMDWAGEVLGKRPDEFAKVFGQEKLVVPPGLPGSDRSYVTFKDKGISIVLESGIATCVHLYSGGRDPAYSEYTGPLPGNVKYTNSRNEARLALGPPTEFEDGAPGHGIGGELLYPWDSWINDKRRITIEYNESKTGIRLVSIMPPGGF